MALAGELVRPHSLEGSQIAFGNSGLGSRAWNRKYQLPATCWPAPADGYVFCL